MRFVLCLLVALAACGFDKPADRCDGTCVLFALDRPIAIEGYEIWLEGTFEDSAIVNFPGGFQQSLDIRTEHRAATSVPAGATAGELTITSSQGTSPPLAFRRASFTQAIQPFMVENEQSDYARINYLPRVKSGTATATIGTKLYFFGGALGADLTDDVEVATAGLDGALGKPTLVGKLRVPRAYHTALVVGRFVYVFGGLGDGNTTVERAAIASDGTLGAFEIVQGLTLPGGRSGHATTIVGNFVYVIGGMAGTTGELATLERSVIAPTGDLGAFEGVAGVEMITARQRFGLAQVGSRLFVIGGTRNGAELDSIEGVDLRSEGDLSAFEAVGKLTTPRSNHVTVIVGDDVYVLGGRNSTGTLDSVERARITQEYMLEFSAMPTLKLHNFRQDAAVALVGNYVYLFGGVEQIGATGYPIANVERASIVQSERLDTFATASSSLQRARYGHASVVIGNKLYVVGGKVGVLAASDTIEVAEIRPDGTLTAFGTYPISLRKGRYGHSLLVNNDTLYVVGGRDTNDVVIASSESAHIASDGSLEAFALSPNTLPVGHSDFSLYGNQGTMFVMGGAITDMPFFTSAIDTSSFTTGTAMQPFQSFGQNLIEAREGAEVMTIGAYVHVFGGAESSSYRGNVRAEVDIATGALMRPFAEVPRQFVRPRKFHVMARVGNTVYAFGGENAATAEPVEASKLDADGNLGAFSLQPDISLVTPRSQASTVTLGNYLYVIGGSSNGAPLASLELTTIR